MTTGARISTDEVRISLAADSLRHFIREAWPLVEPAMPMSWGWHLDAICEHLEAVTAGEITRLLINVPPRCMKSLATSVFWPSWEWLKRPETRYLSASHSAGLAIRDALRTRRLMQTRPVNVSAADLEVLNRGVVPSAMQRIGYQGFLAALAGADAWGFAGDQNLKSRYENTRAGYRIATGLVGGATGEGGDRVLIDDPHKLEEWDSETRRKEAIAFATEIAPSRLNAADSAIVMIMQRVHEADATAAVAGELEDHEGWDDLVHLCLPMQYEPTHPFVWPRDPRDEVGELLWPDRFDVDRVASLQRSLGSLKWAGNYQQRPSPVEGDVFKRDDWRFYLTAADLPPTWELALTSWDATFGESDDPGASYVVGQLWAKDGPDVYLLAQIRDRMSFSGQQAAMEALREFAAELGALGPIIVENKAAGKALVEELKKKVAGVLAREPMGSKVARAVAVQPYQEANNVHLPAGSIPAPAGYVPTPTSAFVEEHAQFPAGAHDDQVDALSQGLTEIFLRSGEVASIETAHSPRPRVIRKGGLVLRGDRYIDKDPEADEER